MSNQDKISNLQVRDQMSTILQQLVADLLLSKPDDPIPHIVQYLQELKGQGSQPLSKQEKIELNELRETYKKLKTRKSQIKRKSILIGEIKKEDVSSDSSEEEIKDDKKKRNQHYSSSEDSQEEFLDEINDQFSPIKNQDNIRMAQRARISVSAEVFGKYNMKEEYKQKVIPKNKDTIEKIKNRLSQAFMFMNLEEKNLKEVIDAMDSHKAQPKDLIIKEGEPGEVLYIVESGEMTCSKIINGETKILKKYNEGDVFGELALLYNAPRAATIQADTECFLWVLDRQTFNHIVKDASQNKRAKYEKFLSTVPILQNMDHYERSKLADAVKEIKYGKNQQIIRQGETNDDTFYILVEGEAYATLNQNPKEVVMKYHPGDYFGELALLRGEPRAANVISKVDCKLISLDRKSFKRLLGPLNKILKRNMMNYINYMKQ